MHSYTYSYGSSTQRQTKSLPKGTEVFFLINKNKIAETVISLSTVHQKKIQLNILSHRQTTDAKVEIFVFPFDP